jgi:hypothetical protein
MAIATNIYGPHDVRCAAVTVSGTGSNALLGRTLDGITQRSPVGHERVTDDSFGAGALLASVGQGTDMQLDFELHTVVLANLFEFLNLSASADNTTLIKPPTGMRHDLVDGTAKWFEMDLLRLQTLGTNRRYNAVIPLSATIRLGSKHTTCNLSVQVIPIANIHYAAGSAAASTGTQVVDVMYGHKWQFAGSDLGYSLEGAEISLTYTWDFVRTDILGRDTIIAAIFDGCSMRVRPLGALQQYDTALGIKMAYHNQTAGTVPVAGKQDAATGGALVLTNAVSGAKTVTFPRAVAMNEPITERLSAKHSVLTAEWEVVPQLSGSEYQFLVLANVA